MSIVFKTLQDEVKRRATRDQAGTTFDTAIKNAINFSLIRMGSMAPWRGLRRKATFNTVSSYTTGTYATLTSGSSNFSIAGATMLTDNVHVGRKVKFQAFGTYCFINTITGETTGTIDHTYYGSTTTSSSFEILPQEEYVLPIQCSHRMFMWHEAFGYPYMLRYTNDMDFYSRGLYLVQKYPSTNYRMWGEDLTLMDIRQPSVVTISSSSLVDTAIPVTVFGTVAGYPDYEIITTNSTDGTTAVAGTKSFSDVERIVKNANTVGRITATANSGGDTLAVLPVGDITSGIAYAKVQLYPLPNSVFPIHVEYYKYPYRLVNDGDVHEFGEDFDEAIILLSTAKIKAEANLAEADRFMMLWQDEMRQLKSTNCDKFDWIPSLRRPRQGAVDALVAPNLLFRQIGGAGTFGPASRF